MRILMPLGAVAAWSALAGALTLTPVAAAVAAERDRTGVIEEIIVTSRRTAESLQDVPVSVTAFRQEDIARIAPKTLRDFDGLMPNVFIGMNTAGPSAGAIYIRGLGYADIEKTQASAVGVIVDGLFQPSSTGQLIDTFDIEQVEVNRGPQGVLYGKNTTGGTIVVNRVKPNTERFGFNVAAQAGRFDERIVKARVNLPFNDMFAVKVGGIAKESDGYYRNINRGGSAGDIDYKSFTTSMLLAPSDSFSAQLTYDKIRDRGDIPPQDPRYNGPDPFVNEGDFDEYQYLDTDSWGLQIEWVTDQGTFTSITGLVESTDIVGQDFDGSNRNATAVPLVQLHTLRDQDYDTFTQEFRWAGDINDRLSYQVGAFYMKTELDFAQGTNQVLQFPAPAFGPVFDRALGLPAGTATIAPGCLVAGIAPVPVPIPGFVPNPAVGDSLCQFGSLYAGQRSSENTESLGYFGNVTWQATERLELSAGARYIDDKKDFKTAFFNGVPSGPIEPPTQVTGAANLSVPKQEDSWSDTIFKVTGTYTLSDTSNVYASFSQGFRSGGFSIRGILAEFLPYDPENVDSWEIGSKNEFLDGRMRLNVAAFVNILQNAQFSSVLTDQQTPGSPGTNTLVNNAKGDIEIRGLEAEMTAVLSDGLSLIVTAGYQDDKSDRFQISSRRVIFNQVSGTACNAAENPALFPNNCPDLTIGGGALARTPEWNWSSTLVYGREIGPNYLQASVTARGQDEWVISGGATAVTPEFEDGYTLVDARVSFEFGLADERNVVVSLVGKNLTDKEYREQTLILGAGGGFQGWAPPRTYAIELVWNN
ncbi:MAG: TonB-dependent receptor [Pseudomonadales bacterium]|nr:TonB-dependent receptor [Pseudomonadales bacterium]